MVVLTVFLGLAGVILIAAQQKNFLRVMGGGSTIGAELVGVGLERYLRDGDTAGVEVLLNNAGTTQPVIRAFLMDSEGRIMRQGPGSGKVGEQGDPYYATLARRAVREKRAVGEHVGHGHGFVTVREVGAGQGTDLFLAMDVSLGGAWDFLRTEARFMVVALFGVGAVVTICLLLGVKFWVLAPLDRLRKALERVEKGDFETSIRVEGAPELMRVSRAFNHMVARLEAASRAVERAHYDKHALAERAVSLNALASVLAHELRNPMSGIAGALELLKKDIPPDHRHQRLILAATHQVGRINRELDDLLAYARPAKEERREPVDLGILTRRTVAFLRPAARSEGVDLHVTVTERLPDVRGEADRLEQVLLNVVQNGVWAARGSRQALVEVHVRSAGDGSVIVEVFDSGPGISPDESRRIFELFYTTRKDGTGLGLPVARRIAELHGGDLTAGRSRLGGAAFTLSIPAVADSDAAADELSD